MTIEEAREELKWATDDIEEAQSFADREQYVTAVGILTGVARTMEQIAKAYPQFENEIAPLVKQATTLTMVIIKKAG